MGVNLVNKKVFRGIGLVLLVFCARLSFAQKSQDDTPSLRGSNAARTDSIVIGKQFVTVSANRDLKPTATRNFFIGKNYRAEWIEAVKVPVLDLADAHLKPIKEGGGKQTRSLKVEDKEGNEYSLRSIRKYPEKAIPEELRNTIGAKWVMDGISASYPYGGLSMPTFSEAANIPYFPLRLAYVGDDPALDSFRSKYKNTLALFEDARPAGSVIQAKQVDDKTYDTRELILELQKTNKNRIDQTEVLRARLLDNYVMDFDRHEGQWKWMKVKSASDSQVYVAVPKDHDQVFFTNQGLLPKIVKGILPELQGFKVKA